MGGGGPGGGAYFENGGGGGERAEVLAARSVSGVTDIVWDVSPYLGRSSPSIVSDSDSDTSVPPLEYLKNTPLLYASSSLLHSARTSLASRRSAPASCAR